MLRFPGLPLVNVGNKNKETLLPPEVCEILPNQPFRGKLSDIQTAEMIKIACNPPTYNQRATLEQGLPRLGLVPGASLLESFGISIGDKMAVVPGRILPPPTVSYAKSQANINDRASWNLANVQFPIGARLANCAALIVQDGGRDDYKGANDPELRNVGCWHTLEK